MIFQAIIQEGNLNQLSLHYLKPINIQIFTQYALTSSQSNSGNLKNVYRGRTKKYDPI